MRKRDRISSRNKGRKDHKKAQKCSIHRKFIEKRSLDSIISKSKYFYGIVRKGHKMPEVAANRCSLAEGSFGFHRTRKRAENERFLWLNNW